MTQNNPYDELQTDEVVAMAAAAAAEMLGEDVDSLRVVSFREIRKSALAQYLADNHIEYTKYRLPR